MPCNGNPEHSVRRKAARHGYRIHKSRSRTTHLNNHGEFMLVENDRNIAAMGQRRRGTGLLLLAGGTAAVALALR